MSDISRSQSFQKPSLNYNDSFASEYKCAFDDITYKPRQYNEDARDYYNLFNKRDSMVENFGSEEINIKSKEESSSINSSSGLKQLYMLRALSKLSKKDTSKFIGDRSPQTKSSIKLIKNVNGSLVMDRDDQTPKRQNGENNDSCFKYMIPSAFDSCDQQKDLKFNSQKNNFDNTQQNFTVACGDQEGNQNDCPDDQTDAQVSALNNNLNVGVKKQIVQVQKNVQKENKLKKILQNFNKLNNIKKFVKKMTSLSPQFNYRRLKDFHFEVIGDIVQVISSQFIKQNNGFSLYILKPNEIFSLVWEIFEILFLFFHVIAFGFRFGYGIYLNYYIKIFSIIFFVLDLLVIMNTGFYQGIEIVTDRFKIIKYNIFNIFMIIISLVALIFSDQGPMQFVFIFRIKQLYRSYNHFEQNFQIKQKHPVSATLVRLFLIIILLAHYNACGFYFFTTNYNNTGPNWLDSMGISESAWETQYIIALYFSFITMVTVGYGDVVPKTQNERIYIIFFVLISAITFAYVVNTIGSLFQELSRLEGKFSQKKYEIMNYMEERDISKPIQISVIKFLEFNILQEKELNNSVSGEKFLQSIPLNLRQQVYQEYYGRILQEIKLFSMNFSKDFLKQLSVLMKEKTFGPGEEVFKQGDKNNTFFFINKGIIEFDVQLQGNNIMSLGTLKKGDSFNHKGLFTDYIHEVTARCKSITQIIYLNQEDFQRVLKQNKDEYEKYCMMKDKYFQEYFSLGEQCLSCKEFNHSVLSCNLIRYMPNRYNLIAKNQYSVPIINRTLHERNKKSIKYNSLLNNYEVKQSLKLLRLQLSYMLMGQKLGSFTELAEKVQTDEQFFKFYPELQMNSQNYIYINSIEDLNKSFEESESDIIQNNNNVNATNIMNSNNNQLITRDSANHDTFLLKFGKPSNTSNSDQLHSQLSATQQEKSIAPSEEHIEVLSPNKKNLITEEQTNDNSIDDQSQGIPSKLDIQHNQLDKPDRGFQRMVSYNGGKEIIQTPQQQQKQAINRRISILQANARDMFQQPSGSTSFHNILNINQSHNEFNNIPLSFNETSQIQQSNTILQQILSQLQQISSHAAGGGGAGGGGGTNQLHTNQHQPINQNKRTTTKSLTQINREQQANMNLNNHTMYMQSYTKIPTNNNNQNSAVPHEKPILGEVGGKFYLQHDFDLLKEFKYYFPSMNFSSVKVFYSQYIENKQRKRAQSLQKKK